MTRLYVFGNEYLAEDAIARLVAAHMKDVEVVHCRSPDDLLTVDDDPIRILDVVKNTDKVVTITDQERVKARNIMSMHDFDLGYFLKLLRELGEEKHVKIIGIPAEGDPQKIAEEVQECI